MGPKGDEVRETNVSLIYALICSGYLALAVDKWNLIMENFWTDVNKEN